MERSRTDRVRLLALGTIVLAAFAFRLWGITWGLHNANVSRRPHPDEWVLYWVFQWFDAHHSLNPCAHGTTGCFFDWGSVYLYLAYAVHALTGPALMPILGQLGPNADARFVSAVLAGRLASALASTVTVPVVYRLAARAYEPNAGLVAALLVAFSGLLIQLAHFATPDMTVGLLMSISLLAMYRAMSRPTGPRFGVAGALVGLSAGAEYHMVLLSIPLTCAWLLAERGGHTGDDTRSVTDGWHARIQRQAPGWLLAAYVCAAASFAVSNLYAMVDFPAFVASLEHTIRIRTVDSQAQYQGRWAAYGPSLLYVIRYPLGYGVGWAFTLLMIAGALRCVLRRRKADLLLLSWLLPYFLLVTASTAKFMRYSAPLLPPLCILAGALVVEVARRQDVGYIRFRRGLLRAVIAVCLAYSLVYDAAYAGLFTSPDPRLLATSWLSDNAPKGSRVAFEELPNGLLNLPYFVSAAGYRPCFSQFDPGRLSGPMQYVMLDSYSLEEHPDVTNQDVLRFRQALMQRAGYALVKRVHYVPTFLGFRFPIDGSPHDWRYPTHEIAIYRRSSASAPSPALRSACYPDLHAALAALYVQPSTH